MSRRLIASVAVLAVAPFTDLACVGDAPPGGGPDAALGGDASGDAPPAPGDGGADVLPSLGCPSGCLPSAPSGWIGPSAIYDGPSSAKPAGCTGAVYTQKELEAHQGLDAGPAACACGAPQFGGDGHCTAGAAQYAASNCTGQPTLLSPMGGKSCQNPGANGYVKLDTPAVDDAGTCAFPSPTASLPDASFTAENVSCGLGHAVTCPSAPACVQTPVPPQPFTRVCIHQDGDTSCPSADYSKRFIAYRDLVDTRSCTACAGTSVGGSCGTGWASLGGPSGCNVVSTYPYSAGTSCVALGTTSWIATNFLYAGTTCAADGGAPQGGVASKNPVTFCCND